MARGIEGNEMATPKTGPKKSANPALSGMKQRGIAGFFKPLATQAESNGSVVQSPMVATTPVSNVQTADLSAGAGSIATPKDSIMVSSPLTRTGVSQQSSLVDERNKENGTSCLMPSKTL